MHKWPKTVAMIRHGQTDANLHQTEKLPGFPAFKEKFDQELAILTPETFARGLFPSAELKEMAADLLKEYTPDYNDFDTRLTEYGWYQARETGRKLPELLDIPDKIYVSPYRRTRETLEGIMQGWPELQRVKVAEDERIREREHGINAIYGHWAIAQVLNPQHALLYKISQYYEHKETLGESLLDVRERTRGFVGTLIREHGGLPETPKDRVVQMAQRYSRGGTLSKLMDYAGIEPDTKPEDILVVTHSLTIMALRATLERWDRAHFMREHKENFPVNCGVTIYRGKVSDPGRSRQGSNGRLVLDPKEYNIKLWDDKD